MVYCLMLSGVKKTATHKLAKPDINPDINDRNSEIVTRKIVQRRCSPALAREKFAPVRMVLVKSALRISAWEKFAPVRMLLVKFAPVRMLLVKFALRISAWEKFAPVRS